MFLQIQSNFVAKINVIGKYLVGESFVWKRTLGARAGDFVNEGFVTRRVCAKSRAEDFVSNKTFTNWILSDYILFSIKLLKTLNTSLADPGDQLHSAYFLVSASFLVGSRSVLGCTTPKQPQCNEDATVRWGRTVFVNKKGTVKEQLQTGPILVLFFSIANFRSDCSQRIPTSLDSRRINNCVRCLASESRATYVRAENVAQSPTPGLTRLP